MAGMAATVQLAEATANINLTLKATTCSKTHNYQVVTTSNKALKSLGMVNSRAPICQEVAVGTLKSLAVTVRRGALACQMVTVTIRTCLVVLTNKKA